VSAAKKEIDRLYGLPLDEFTEARNALARRFRDQGQQDSAERIKGLRKPSLPAWVINQLARQRELDVQRLVKAGERLSSAQAEAIKAHTGDAFLDARRDEQHALERLAAHAKDILSESGRGGAALDRIVTTLRAASLTEAGRKLLKEGQLTEELEPPGFEALAGLGLPRIRSREPPREKAAAPAGPPQRRKQPEAEQKRELAIEARRRIRELRNQLRELDARARKAKRNTSQIEKELQAAVAETDAIERERRQSQEELSSAERDLAQLASRG
jgi:hypothetical protein